MTLDARLLEAGSAALPWVWCGLTLSIGLWEVSAPLRTLRSPHLPRWVANLGLTVLDVLLLRAIFPLLGVGVALVLYEILHAFATFLGHANARLPAGIERAARLVFVTPDIHRVHHSALAAEASSNFGMILTLWDRLFGSFRAEPAAGHAAMTVGLPELQDPAGLSLASLLLHPFAGAGPSADEPEPVGG